ncbi:putative Carboxymuconolactone decarboxylase [Legionella steigerwaltii]|uniref:Carboxymuconolactone decarboxylase n=1 Tax=Legionella steigerwaltii TaxID=460 RepID=A0A378LCH3_9GAMM|nr:carboxymuconolactone decarboxylase family protein [Legionella steigerwaltii]KTD70316.1 putative Carboxymuconolactone decarboxylase [Legionella steigerwaltii]STY24050.1 putative Carboxymuconolactone decarboxylase [Legionella steigerwaltii]
MHTRVDFYKAAPDAVMAMLGIEKYVSSCGLEQSLLNLVKLRASQINGCVYCVDLHSAEAKKEGESERRLHSVVVWRESPFFTTRERVALAWTEAVTLLSETHVPDDIYNQALTCFNEKELIDLTMAIIAINSWNRLSVSFRKLPS